MLGTPRDQGELFLNMPVEMTPGDRAKDEKSWISIDAGLMAMSQDRGTARPAVDQRYGLVCNVTGDPDLILADANQEHGIITGRPASNGSLPNLVVGDRVRIFPNHACATAAQHRAYYLVRDTRPKVEAERARFGGW